MKTATASISFALLLVGGCSLWAQQGSTSSSTNKTPPHVAAPPARPVPTPPQIPVQAPPRTQPQSPTQPQSHPSSSAATGSRGTAPRYAGRSAASSAAPQSERHNHPEEPRTVYVGYYYPYTGYVPSSQQPTDDGANSDVAYNDSNSYDPNAGPVQEYTPSSVPMAPMASEPPATPSVDASAIPPTPPPSLNDDTAILVFKDGRKMTVKGFAIYGGYVILATGDVRRIPLVVLDLPATTAANDDAGFDFRLPAVYRE